jgi:hypothetical protein
LNKCGARRRAMNMGDAGTFSRALMDAGREIHITICFKRIFNCLPT